MRHDRYVIDRYEDRYDRYELVFLFCFNSFLSWYFRDYDEY